MSRETIIPKKDHEFHVMQKRICTLVNDNAYAGRWGLDVVWIAHTFIPAYNAWTTAYNAWADPVGRTAAITAAKNAKRAIYEPLLRLLIKELKINTRVTFEDREAIGLPEADHKPTPVPVPTTLPVASIHLPSPGVVDVSYHDSANAENKKRGKPRGVHGVEILWAVLDEHPGDDWSRLTHSDFDTASPFRFRFDGHDRGRHLYFTLRWENTRGQKGELSPIYEAVIP